MRPNTRKTHRTASRVTVEDLEPRSLLSTMSHHHEHALAAKKAPPSLLNQLPQNPTAAISTVPSNGDLNPYGVAFVPAGFAKGGTISTGDVLVANFNAGSHNFQGTGTTIDSITPQGQVSTFFQENQSNEIPGLTGALAGLKSGFVVVGALPTTDGTQATVGQGGLMVLDKNGNDVLNIPSNGTTLDGPWGLAVKDTGSRVSLFVANVLNGTVSRIDLKVSAKTDSVSVTAQTTIGSGYQFAFNSSALVTGPAGLAFDPARNILYVASTQDNEIFAIRNASRAKSSSGTGSVVFQDTTHLHGPIGLAFAGNGNLIAANGDAVNADSKQNSELVEFTPKGQFVAQFSLDAGAAAAPFDLAVETVGKTTVLVAVNDNTNQLEVFAVSKHK
jgi:hypothetical protein